MKKEKRKKRNEKSKMLFVMVPGTFLLIFIKTPFFPNGLNYIKAGILLTYGQLDLWSA
jgi:hypothetical protein